jgi:membrane fusion protein, heavy metal efflux system
MRWYLLWFIPMLALAHGGDDHQDKAVSALSDPHAEVASATGSVFEVVLKAEEITPNKEVSVRVLVSDVETNAPIKEASIMVSMKSASARLFSGKATPTKTDGIYEFPATFPAVGVYGFDLTIQAAGRADLLVIPGFEVRPPAMAISGSSLLALPVLLVGGLGLFILALFIGFFLGRRQPIKGVVPASEER